MSTTGWDLKAERVRHGLRAADIARQCGVSRQRISNLEASMRPPADWVERYMAAIRVATSGRDEAA